MHKLDIVSNYKLMKTPSGFSRSKIAMDLQRLCLKSPQEVAQITFDTEIADEIRENVLFVWSKDHLGSARIKDNPRWAIMMRTYIIPRCKDLPFIWQIRIKWYQKVHSL